MAWTGFGGNERSGGAQGWNDAGAGSYTRTEGGWTNSYNDRGYQTASARAGTAEANAAIAGSRGATNPYSGGRESNGGRGGGGTTAGGQQITRQNGVYGYYTERTVGGGGKNGNERTIRTWHELPAAQQQQMQSQTPAGRQQAAAQAAAQAEQARQQAAAAEAARQAEIARQKEITRQAQVAERDKAVGIVSQTIAAGERTVNAVQGIYKGVNNFIDTAGGLAKKGTVAGALYTGLRDAYRGFSMLGPLGGILGAVYGMAEGAGALDKMTLETLKGYNPNGEGGVTSAGDLAKRVGPFWNTGGNDHEVTGRAREVGNGPSQPTPKDTQAAAAINQLIPQSARSLVAAGEAASNSYLKALRGRYAKYMLATGAEGSGTSLLQRTAGGVGALGGVTGQLLYSKGGNQ